MAKSTRDIIEGMGERLKEIRLDRGLTGGQLAELAGTGQGTISAVENDLRSPSARLVRDLARALGCSMDALCDQPPGSPIPRRKKS